MAPPLTGMLVCFEVVLAGVGIRVLILLPRCSAFEQRSGSSANN